MTRWCVQSITSVVKSRALNFGGGGTTTSTTKADPWSGQQPYLTSGFGAAQNLYQPGNPSAGPQYYPGQTIADPTQAQTLGLQETANRGLYGTDPGNAASGAITGVLNGSPEMTSHIASQVMPQIEGQFAGGNRLDSGLASRAVGSGMTDAILQNQLGYANAGMNAQNMQLGASETAANAGQQQQQLQQNQINDQIQRFNYGQQLPYSNLNNYMNLVQGNYGGTSSSSQPYFQNTLGQVGSALGGIASLASIFSDERLKTDIRPAGEIRGAKLYRYHLKGLPQTNIGVLAQELMKTKPEAVHMTPYGYYAVDYRKVA